MNNQLALSVGLHYHYSFIVESHVMNNQSASFLGRHYNFVSLTNYFEGCRNIRSRTTAGAHNEAPDNSQTLYSSLGLYMIVLR